jgi:hypothetical protein
MGPRPLGQAGRFIPDLDATSRSSSPRKVHRDSGGTVHTAIDRAPTVDTVRIACASTA